MTRRTSYSVAGESVVVEARGTAAADAIDALFGRWYLTPDAHIEDSTSPPALVMSSGARAVPNPLNLQAFEVAGGGTCYTDGATSYIDINGSIVAMGEAGRPGVEVWMDESLPQDAPGLTRVVTYALAAALRQRRRFELHSGAVIDPENGRGVLVIGPSGSGKSTLTVHLASAGWPFLTDDVLLLSGTSVQITAWPLRRWFAVTSDTLASSRVLRSRTSLDQMDVDSEGKRHFLPHSIFATEFKDRCVPATLLFSELSGTDRTRVSRLSRAEALARLIRMNPWSCYDRRTAAEHLAVLSALAKQAAAYAVSAGRDLLDADTAVAVVSTCTREATA